MIRAQHLLRIFFVGLLFFPACVSSKGTTPEPTLPQPSSVPTQMRPTTGSNAFTQTLEPSPIITQTNSQPSPGFTIFPTTLQHPGVWDLRHTYSDPDRPQLISLTSDGYRLEPTYQVASIELTYNWIGIGDPVRIYQRIEKRDGSFWRGTAQITTEAVDDLIQSIARLRPQPHILSATTHTDDYPFWAIELTGLGGEHLLLYSESNSPDFIPWNVIDNGHIYAQFDGGITAALPGLFDIVEGETLASFWPPEKTPGYLTVVTTEEPAQLVYGFNGLLPLYNAITYHPDRQRKELIGRIRTLTWNEIPGNMINGSITDLQKVELEAAGQSVPCSVEFLSSSNPESVSWDFVCPVEEVQTDLAYHYPISVSFSTSTDQIYMVSGQLYGFWEPVTTLPFTPYPEEIGEVLESSPVVRDLLGDHQVHVLNFVAEADLQKGFLDFNWEAELVLLGQAMIGARALPYTVSLQVNVVESKLTHWDLNRSELLSLAEDMLSQAITQHFLNLDPDLVLNLYYGEISEYPIVDAENLKPCGSLPVVAQLPSPGNPLRGFGFDQRWNLYAAQILLIGDGLRINHLDIEPDSPEDTIWTSLLPPEFKPPGLPPLHMVFKRPMSQAIGLYWDENASPAAVESYKAIYEKWNVPKENKDHGVFIDQVMFDITADGRLALVFCQ